MQVADACDENTIGVAAILGTTYSGHFEDVAGIDAAVGAHIISVCTTLSLKCSNQTFTPP